jgi:hypothetical protein
MLLEEDFGDLFNNRDLNGNEPDELDTSDSDSDLESNLDTETDFGEDELEEAVEEDQEQLDQVPLSFSAQKVKHILEEMDRINLKLADFLDALSWGDVQTLKIQKFVLKEQYYYATQNCIAS